MQPTIIQFAMLIPALACALAASVTLLVIERLDIRRTRRIEAARAEHIAEARRAEEKARLERGRDVIRFAERYNAGRGA